MTVPQRSSIRFDRVVTLNLVRHIRRGGSHEGFNVPILMYHGIREEIGHRHPYFETNTSRTVFACHMQYLYQNRYTPMHLTEAVEAIKSGHAPSRGVVITFDDGFRDFYTDAFPVLAHYGFRATVFVISGHTSERPVRSGDSEFMSWPELRELCKHGVEIGSHTKTHPELAFMPSADLERELADSKKCIEDALGIAVRSFAYPFAFPEQDGRFVNRLRALLQFHGYKNGVSTIIGTAFKQHDPFFLPRVPVNSHDDLTLYAAKLKGSYDWLHAPQLLSKYVKHYLRRDRQANER